MHTAPDAGGGQLCWYRGGLRPLRNVNVQCNWQGRVGFEPTIPDLETGALGQAKLRPYRCRHVAIFQNWSLGAGVERLFPEPQSGVLAAELPQGWCAKIGVQELVAKDWWQRNGAGGLI